MNTTRQTRPTLSISAQTPSQGDLWLRLIRASVLGLGVSVAIAGTVMVSALATSASALAADDDDDSDADNGLMGKLMKGMGALSPTDKGITYRERSPLVVPPRLDLPSPQTTRVEAPNWPKDPDVTERKARREAAKQGPLSQYDQVRSLSPSELNAGAGARVRGSTGSVQPGVPEDYSGARTLSPSQLGTTNVFTKLFKKKSDEVETFKGEPSREDLTQPPSGYQTPSPSYAYGLTDAPKAEVTTPSGNMSLNPSQMR